MRLQLLLLTLILCAKAEAQEWVTSQAQITALETRILGRNTVTTAKIKYAVVSSEDSLSSQVRLFGLPFFGLSKEVGDRITVEYQKDNPYVVRGKEDSFLQTYGFYILIVFGIVISGYRWIKIRQTS